MEINRCVNCMEEIEGEVCPKCGFKQIDVGQQPVNSLRCNTVLHGRYLVGRLLGQGGFGMTYIGFDLLLNIKVAIKEYFPMGNVSRDNSTTNLIQWNYSTSQEEQWKEGCENFLKEARKMAKLDNVSGIVRVRDTFYENQTSYIIMDFIEGITLKQQLSNNGPLDYTNCINLLAPLMSSLSKVHGQGLIHRDISPDNIMINEEGRVMLLDLGAAKDISVSKEGMSQLVTKKGFSPAEQYMESGSVGSWTDVYALCATMYYCIYGKVIPEAMERIMDDSLSFPVLPSGVEIPEDIKDTLTDGLAVNVENRIQTMDELLARLAPYITSADSEILTSMQNYSISTKAKRKKKKKKAAKIIIPTVSVILCAAVVTLLMIFKPWMPKIEMLGNSNSNMLNDGGFALKENEYEYYLDHDSNLNVCKYDGYDGYFYIDNSVIVAEDASNINIGKNAVYFMQSEDDGFNLCEMNFDGSNVNTLMEGDTAAMLLQYTLLSNDKEYLYFAAMNDDETATIVQRYNIADGKTETIIGEDIFWFNVYGDSIYYVILNDSNTILKKSDLNGKHIKTLDSDKLLSFGFVENDKIYMYSLAESAMVVLDLKGNEERILYDAHMDITNYTFAYYDGWIYYVNESDGNLYHIREDGTGNDLLLEDKYAISICVNNNDIWLLEGVNNADDGSLTLLRTYFVSKDGSSILELDESDIHRTESGLLYKQEGDSLVICGYEGDGPNVGIPLYIDGLPVMDIETDNMPGEYSYYLYAEESDFDYVTTEDGSGIVITGYVGDLTSFMIPDEIEGLPVVGIGDSAFVDTEVESVVLGKYVKTINDGAFQFVETLSYIYLPEGLEVIGSWALEDTGLTELDLPSSLTTLGFDALLYTPLNSLYIPANLSSIDAGGISVYSPDGITVDEANPYFAVSDGVLYSKDLTTLIYCPYGREGSFVIPENVTTIAKQAFDCSELTEVSAAPGSSLSVISDFAFHLSDNLTRLDFSNCNYVTSIASYMTYECGNLTEVYFPRNSVIIPEQVFRFSDDLSRVVCNSESEINEDAFDEGVEIQYYEDEDSGEAGE